MQVVYERCCGLDVHKKIVVACLIVLATNGQRHKEFRTFGTMTRDLLALLDWLREAGWVVLQEIGRNENEHGVLL
jgi:transposase